MADKQKVGNLLALSDVIKALRQELLDAKDEGEGEDIRFNVNNIEIELETVVEKEASGEGSGKIRFWLVDVDAKLAGKYKNATRQKIKLSLEAVEKTKNKDGSSKKVQVHGKVK